MCNATDSIRRDTRAKVALNPYISGPHNSPVVDLLKDLLHWCGLRQVSFQRELDVARDEYDAEMG